MMLPPKKECKDDTNFSFQGFIFFFLSHLDQDSISALKGQQDLEDMKKAFSKLQSCKIEKK